MYENLRVFSDPKPRRRLLLALVLAGAVIAVALLVRIDLTHPSSTGFVAMALLGPTMAAVDVREYRLPDILTLIIGCVAVLGAIITCALENDWSRLSAGALCAIATTGAFYLISLLAAGGFGLGDIKLLAVIGFTAGLHGWQTLVYCITAAFVIGAIAAIVARMMRSGMKEIPFGPFLIAATITTGFLAPTGN